MSPLRCHERFAQRDASVDETGPCQGRRSAMNRRDLHGLALGAGVSSLLAKSAAAQMSGGEAKPAEAKPPISASTLNTVQVINTPRNYNQINTPRKYTPGKPRFSIYWSWSFPWEA